jgi:hypothetical protein
MARTTSVLVLLIAWASCYFGLAFLLSPHWAASGFGIDPWPRGDAAGYFVVKAMRDIAAGIVILTLLARGHRGVLAWVLLIDTVIPLGDMSAVLTHGGSPATALGIHGATAAFMLVVAALLGWEGRRTARTGWPRPLKRA